MISLLPCQEDKSNYKSINKSYLVENFTLSDNEKS